MNSTKKTFLTSLMALLLCVVMLMGTTFAWFTDVVTSTGNIIQAGNLDAEMYYSETLENPDWKNADGPAVFNYDKWEPGYTSVRYIKVKNAGKLNFKFQLSLDANGVVSKLGDVIDVYFFNPATEEITTLDGLTKVDNLTNVIKNNNNLPGTLAPGAEVILAIALHMQESAGNEYQKLELCEGGFDLKLIATQVGVESDSFGPDYDDGATWEDTLPEQSTASSAMELNEDGTLPNSLTFANDDGTISITVPAGTKFKQGTKLANLNVNKLATSGANITLEENEETRSFDVHVANLDESNTKVISIAIKEFLPAGLNMGNYHLYHVEDGQTVEMQLLADGETPVHNSFNYDPATGDVVLHLASFSEVALVADTENAWEGNFDYSWYDASKTELTIANADQLAAFGAIVGGMKKVTGRNDDGTYTYSDDVIQDSFAGKTVKLISDINLGDDEEHNVGNKIFYPIGYWNNEGTYERLPAEDRVTAVSSGFYNFSGTFDGNGHTIANFYQNTWEMKGDHNWYDPIKEQYYRDGMGLFGKIYGGTVKNLTVKNFSSDGEIATTGVIAAYADGATFENIAIFNCNPRVYNIGNGGIVGCIGWYAKEADLKTTFKNVTVDNSNKISALWGSYDVACGGIVGQYYPTSGQTSAGTPKNAGLYFENCHVAAQMDVYNDVCANYQYYAYRYTGMLIGSVRENVTIDGHSYPKMDGITAKDCTVHFGTWNDYYYCEFEKNSMASYSEDYQFSRIPHSEINFTDSNDNGIIDTDEERASVTGCTHTHTPEEDKQCVYLPFNNLVTGYGWGVTSKGVGDLAGVTILDREVGNSVEKFEGKVNKLTTDRVYTIDEIFAYIENCGVKIVDGAVNVTITNFDENGNVKATFNRGEKWNEGKISFDNAGNIAITIQDYYFCEATTITVNVIDRQPEEKFDIVMNNGDFLHRVGNSGTVALDKLFKAKDGATIGEVSVTIEAMNATAASGTYTANNTWANGTIQFSGTGIVKVTIKDDDTYCIPTELLLEVVDAVNVTSATSATSNNVVLLNDAGFSSLEVSGGYTLYGNGFTLTCGSDSPALDTGYAFVTLNDGILDNVQIVLPNFDYAVLYKSNMTESGNRSQTTDKTRYYNVKSGVMVSGNSQILNSRISGARAAVNVTGGNCLIDNSRLEGGAVASLLIGSANSVTLRDVTLVQKPTASTYDSIKILMGFSVLFVCDADGNTAPLTLEGTLVQNAWVDENDKQYVPSEGQSIISTVLGKTDYLHDIDGDGTNESLNLGFAYMPESLTSKVNTTTITDNRTNKNDVPYDYAEISILNGKTYVYSYKNTNGTVDYFKTESEYVPNKYGDIITVEYSDTKDGLESDKSFGTNGWVYELNVDLDKVSGYKFDFSKLSMTVNGVPVTDFKVNGSAKPTSPVAVTSGGVTYTLTATIDGKEYTATYKVTGTETSKESPSKISGPTTAGFGVAKSYGGDWSGAADVLTGVKIKYWSVAENKYVEFDFSDFTVPGNAGKLNGTNSYWEYTHTNNDFTLKVTNTVAIHSGKSVFGMPIRGTDGKLYFTISSTNGYVGSGTTSRAITMQYEFTDNNGGEKLTFTHTFNISYSKDEQYSYSDLSGSGTLTKLESSSDGCVTPDTLITLADGTRVRVDSLTGNEELLVWNMETGKFDKAPIMFLDSDAEAEYEVIKLYFSDGTEVKVIYEHGFWDYDLNKYVYLDRDAAQYIGHTFAKQNGDKLEKVQLVDVVIEKEMTTAWSPVTEGHLCYFVNGMLSMPGGVGGLFNVFEVDPETMTYDFEQMEKDIETYGLFTYEELNAICPLSEEMFNAAGGAYLKISIGKGNLTMDELVYMINRYSVFFE